MNKGKNSSFNNKDKNELKMFDCEYCDKPFSQDGLKSHVNEFHKALKCGDCKKHHLFGKCEKKYLCQFCNKSFYGKDYYINHIKTVHEIVSLDQKDHKCELCEKSFSQSANLKKHVTTVHKGAKKFKCLSCGKLIPDVSVLNNIIHKFHNVSKDYTCDNCGKLNHPKSKNTTPPSHTETVHEEKKTFSCKSCDKRFTQSRNLKLHINKVHKGQEIFPCKSCGKNFTQSNNLILHINSVHKGQKNFPCKSCDKSFDYANALKKHITKAHEKIVPNAQQQDKVVVPEKKQIPPVHEGLKNNSSINCPACEATFATALLFQEHYITHITFMHNGLQTEDFLNWMKKFQKMLKCRCICPCDIPSGETDKCDHCGKTNKRIYTHELCTCDRIGNLQDARVKLQKYLPDFQKFNILMFFCERTMNEDKYAKQFLKSYPKKIAISVPGNGKCFYSALTIALGISMQFTNVLRISVFFKLLEDWDKIQEKVKQRFRKVLGDNEKDVSSVKEDIFAILSNCISMTGYSDYHQIIAASELLNVNINLTIPEEYAEALQDERKIMQGAYVGHFKDISKPRVIKLLFYSESGNLPNHFVLLLKMKKITNVNSVQNKENEKDDSKKVEHEMENSLEIDDDGVGNSDSMERKTKESKSDICKFCDIPPFQSDKDLKQHNLTKHICDTCGKEFKQPSHLQRHINEVHEQITIRAYKCNLCSKGFKNNVALKTHQRVHTQEKKYSCNTCGKVFSSKQTLQNHSRKFHEESTAMYTCGICNKAYPSQSHLNRHINLVHNNKKK